MVWMYHYYYCCDARGIFGIGIARSLKVQPRAREILLGSLLLLCRFHFIFVTARNKVQRINATHIHKCCSSLFVWFFFVFFPPFHFILFLHYNDVENSLCTYANGIMFYIILFICVPDIKLYMYEWVPVAWPRESKYMYVTVLTYNANK